MPSRTADRFKFSIAPATPTSYPPFHTHLARAPWLRNFSKELVMHIVLWDTRKLDAAKDFAGGYGVGQYQGQGGLAGRIVRRFYKRDRRPVALNFAYMSAIF